MANGPFCPCVCASTRTPIQNSTHVELIPHFKSHVTDLWNILLELRGECHLLEQNEQRNPQWQTSNFVGSNLERRYKISISLLSPLKAQIPQWEDAKKSCQATFYSRLCCYLWLEASLPLVPSSVKEMKIKTTRQINRRRHHHLTL